MPSIDHENEFLNKSFTDLGLSTILDVGERITSTLNLKEIVNSILLSYLGRFLVGKGAIYLINNSTYELIVYKGVEKNQLPEEIEINKCIDKEHLILNNSYLTNSLKNIEIDLIKPFISQNQILGFIVLGKKLNNKEYTEDDIKFITTLNNIASPSIENSILIEKLKHVNLALNHKINQVNSLVELSREFNLLLDEKKICKVFSFVVLGNLLISKYAIYHKTNNEFNFIDGNLEKEKLDKIIQIIQLMKIKSPATSNEFSEELKPLFFGAGVEIISPMILRNNVVGYVFLGPKKTNKLITENEKEFLDSLVSLAITSLESTKLFKDSLEKQKLEDDLKIANEIQKKLFPSILPSSDCVKVHAQNIPTRQVGGDYYDVFRINSEEIVYLIADVSGKGIGAALIMANLQAFIKSLAYSEQFHIDSATGKLNDLLFENLPSGKFVTFFWCIINEKNKTLRYVNAGHNPPYLYRNGALSKLEAGGMILGVLKGFSTYISEEIGIEKNDFLVLYTDGVTEAKGINDEEFGEFRLEEFILDNSALNPVEFNNKLYSNIKEFTKGAEQFDDITTLAIKLLSLSE